MPRGRLRVGGVEAAFDQAKPEILTEQVWRTMKYEEVYTKGYAPT